MHATCCDTPLHDSFSTSPVDDDGFALSAQDAVENPSTRARAIRIRMTTSLLQVYLMKSLRVEDPNGKEDVGLHTRRERWRHGAGKRFSSALGMAVFDPFQTIGTLLAPHSIRPCLSRPSAFTQGDRIKLSTVSPEFRGGRDRRVGQRVPHR